MTVLLIFLATLVILVLWYISTYNRFVRLKAMISEAWSGVDVQLKRRHDLLPNLIETVKGYAKHEQTVLADLTRLRAESMNARTVKEKASAENSISAGLRNLFAVAEAYPDLKANQNFLGLQQSLREIEDQIQLARRYYNGTVRNYNIPVQSFPSLLVAKQFGFGPVDYFELDSATEREVPAVKF